MKWKAECDRYLFGGKRARLANIIFSLALFYIFLVYTVNTISPRDLDHLFGHSRNQPLLPLDRKIYT